MICPKCKNEFSKTKNIIYKHGKKNFLRMSCPKCGNIIKEEVSLSQFHRLLNIIVVLPIVFFFVLLSGIVVKSNFNINHNEMIAMVLINVFLLMLIKTFKQKILYKKELQ